MTPALLKTHIWQQFLYHFAAQRYFECHEQLELIWIDSQDLEKVYLQALIQFCVALHHWQNGNLKGSQSLFKKAEAKMILLIHQGHGVSQLLFQCQKSLKIVEHGINTQTKQEAVMDVLLPVFKLDILNEWFIQKPF